jgi:hypothetical protein
VLDNFSDFLDWLNRSDFIIRRHNRYQNRVFTNRFSTSSILMMPSS